MLLAAGAALLVWLTAALVASDIETLPLVLLILAGALSAASIGFFRMRLTQNQLELQEAQAELTRQQEELETLRTTLEKDSAGFESRRQQFEKRLMTYHEWTEFPAVNGIAEGELSPDEVAERDRRVADLTQKAAANLFEGLSKDRYSVDGSFDPRLMANELVEFIDAIAHVYQPNAKKPILETSVERLLKSLNHVSLQLLFQLEQLPLNLKDYSLAKAYEHVKTGSKVYGYYKTISPILPYASYTWQLGRLVLGANPIVAGTWILGGEVVKRTGRRLSKHYLDRYSLKLMSEAVRIVANEAAMTFDTQYRYRDPNWVYGVELAEMVYVFPLSRETLQRALQEIGNLPLRNTYDRIFLYRCLAAGLSPRPDAVGTQGSLSVEQRRQIAERLERFFRHHVHGRRKERVAEWAAAASSRLGVTIQVNESQPQSVSESDQLSALSSLGAFLIAVKEMPLEEVPDLLRKCEVASLLSDEHRSQVIEELVRQPPMFFDYPDLDPESPLVAVYMKDLMKFETHALPKDLQGFWAIREVSEFLRQTAKESEGDLAKAYARMMSRQLDADSPESIQDSGLVLALVRLLQAEESPEFVYSKASPEDDADGGIRFPGKNIKIARWLVGTNQRLMLVEVRDGLELDDFKRQQVVWSLDLADSGPDKPVVTRSRGLMSDTLIIRGGTWAKGTLSKDVVVNPGVKIPGERSKKHSAYFLALHKWLSRIGVLEIE